MSKQVWKAWRDAPKTKRLQHRDCLVLSSIHGLRRPIWLSDTVLPTSIGSHPKHEARVRPGSLLARGAHSDDETVDDVFYFVTRVFRPAVLPAGKKRF
jgi:hypothetical protein